MSEENIRIVREHYAAFELRDLDAITKTLHADVEFVAADPNPRLGMGEPMRGREEVCHFFERIYETTADNHVEIVDLEDSGNQVIASIYLHGTWLESGISGAIQAVHVFTLRDGLIVQNLLYRLPLGDED